MGESTVKYIYWELSNYCNLQCKHCFAMSSNNRSTIVNKQDLFDAIERISQRAFCNSIRFGGGEPLLVSFLPDIVDYCTRRRINVDITTNGTLISNSGIQALAEIGLRELTISVDGLQKAHDYIRGDGRFHSIEELIASLSSTNKKRLSLAFTVTCQNYLDILPFFEKFSELGVQKFYFFRYCGTNHSNLLQLTNDQLFIAEKSIQKIKMEHPQIIIIHEPLSFYPFLLTGESKQGGCNFLDGVLTINYLGDVIVCAGIPQTLGNVFSDNLDDITFKISREKAKMRDIPQSCKLCSFSSTCRGGCKASSYLRSKGYSLRDQLCYRDIALNLTNVII